MLAAGVHPGVAYYSQQVNIGVVFLGVVQCRAKRVVGEKTTIGNRQVDPGQILVDHSTRADVEMAGFGVSIFARRQPHCLASSSQFGMGEAMPEMGYVDQFGLRNRIARTGRSHPPAIENNEYDGLDHNTIYLLLYSLHWNSIR